MTTSIDIAISGSQRPRARAIRNLRDWINSGQMRAGEVLPPEVELAGRLQVARATVRAALERLQEEGMVVQQGRTRIVAANRAAATSASKSIAILGWTPRMDATQTRQSGWEHHILFSAVDTIRDAGWNVLLLQSQHWDIDSVDAAVANRPSGLIVFRYAIATELSHRLVTAALTAGIPTVIYGFGDKLPACDNVTSDHAQGQYLAVKHLIDRGCRRILRFWKELPGNEAPDLERPNWLVRRDEGYERAMREAGLEILPAVEYRSPIAPNPSFHRFELDRRLAAGFLVDHLMAEQPVDAIVCNTDGVVPVVAAACRQLGKTPGADVQIAGYDNYYRESPEQKFFPFAPLVTVDRDNPRLGRELADLLLKRMAGELPAEPQQRLVDPLLVSNAESVLPTV